MSRVEWRRSTTEEQSDNVMKSISPLLFIIIATSLLGLQGAFQIWLKFTELIFQSSSFLSLCLYASHILVHATPVMSDTLAAGSTAMSKEEKKRLKKEKREKKEREDKEVEVEVAADKPEESKEERRARKEAKKAVSRDMGHSS